jgi:hypothetical protein
MAAAMAMACWRVSAFKVSSGQDGRKGRDAEEGDPDLSTVLVSDGRWRSRNRAARYMRSLGDLATFESPMVPDFVTLGLAFNPKT